ncbi:hypothetical protein [Salinicola halophilus]|uniref:hypothetical protein n=1 Tax=Salinicola halophilus TaxID=184065 RepID=UPI0013A5FF49|nr:hypothetical protein [Salinicola halophilus]
MSPSLFTLCLETFEKVASVIEGNENYARVMGGRLETAFYRRLSNGNDFLSREIAVKAFCERVDVLKAPILIPQSMPLGEANKISLIGYGNTKNNRREFDFLCAKAAEYGVPVAILNLADASWKKEGRLDSHLTVPIKHAFQEFLTSRQTLSLSAYHQISNCVSAIAQAYEILKTHKGRIFFVANDHSPLPVAYAKVAEFMGMKVAYLQHASVTNIFPALDFDYAILRDTASREIYEQKRGSVRRHSRIAVVNRDKAVSPDAIEEQRRSILESKAMAVGVYVSSIFNADSIREIIESLKQNQYVKSLFIKFHPSQSDFEGIEDLQVYSRQDIQSVPHVAICGNTSVVLELLQRGNVVFYTSKLDEIGEDYYGYIRSGLIEQLPGGLRSEVFWSQTSREKFSTTLLAYYCGNVMSSDNLSNGDECRNLILSIFEEGLSFEDLSFMNFCQDILFYYPAFERLSRRGGTPYSDQFCLLSLESLFNARNPLLQSLMSSVAVEEITSFLAFWMQVKKVEWNGEKLTKLKLDSLIGFSERYSSVKKIKKWLETKCLDVIMRCGDVSRFYFFIESCKYLKLENLSINRKISCLNFVASFGEFDRRYYELRKDFSKNLHAFDLLKLAVQVHEPQGVTSKYTSYKEIEKAFMTSLPQLAEEYQKFVIEPYLKFSGRDKFIDVKFKDEQKESFLSLVEARLKNYAAFSLIRLSDGEGYLFGGEGELFTRLDSVNREFHWWGDSLPVHKSDVIRKEAISAACEADVIGIPSVYRFLRDHSSKSKSLLQNLQGRGLAAVLKGISAIDTQSKLYADDKINIAVFDKITILRLAKLADKTIVVSSCSREALLNLFPVDLNLEIVEIPTHNKTKKNKKYVQKDEILPNVYEEVALHLKMAVRPGALVLIGAGIVGKIFAGIARENGGVALDLGSVMDQLVDANIHSLY